MSLLEPQTTLRSPEPQTPKIMQRRGWWLIVLGFLLPGTAQIAAGNRRLGRIGLISTFVMWALVLLTVLLWFVARTWLLTLVGNSIGLLVLQIIAVVYAIIWLVLGIDTVRLTKFGRIEGNGRWAIAVLALAAIIVPVGAAGYAANVLGASRGLINDVFRAGGPAQDPIDGHYTFMVLGGDSGEGRDGLRADSIRVVTVNADSGAATMIGIPRNLMNVPFPADSPMAEHWPNGFNCGTSDCMVNAAYTYGMNNPELYPDAEARGSNPGIEATRDAVEGVTGLTIQYYVLIDMHGFQDMVDALGGVEIDVERAIPIGVTGGMPRDWIQPGTQRLNGYYALWYARSRADSSDYDRMGRQQEVLEAMVTQFTPQTLLTSYNQIASASGDLFETDIPQSMIGYFADLANTTRRLPMESLELVPPLVISESPDFALIHTEVAEAMARSNAAAMEQLNPSESP